MCVIHVVDVLISKGSIMPAAALAQNVSQTTTGHGCDTVTTVQGALQTTVKIEGTLASVQGDVLAPHTILSGVVCVPHVANVNAGSSTVRIGGIAAARVGDSADAGNITSGAGTVTIGG